MSLVLAVRVMIAGRVQGVGYRMWLRDEAESLGVQGWTRNRSDGSVEALLVGSHADVEAFVVRCRSGPRGAVVANVLVTVSDDDGSQGFTIRSDA